MIFTGIRGGIKGSSQMDLNTARWVVEQYDSLYYREYYKDNRTFCDWLSEAKRVVAAADYLTNF